ncbi:hypothetical protein FRC20_006452 [Serendipita sp. 405]|nr:hypothetical protein FRC15_006425 [Serendipita sp. 397]KAG8838335.1 hypothetical protein FRC20_006452 [Serendipita sp. 405]
MSSRQSAEHEDPSHWSAQPRHANPNQNAGQGQVSLTRESAPIPMPQTTEPPSYPPGAQAQLQYCSGYPSTHQGHALAEAALLHTQEGSYQLPSASSSGRDQHHLATTSSLPRATFRRRPAPKKDISEEEEEEEEEEEGVETGGRDSSLPDNIARLSTHGRRKNYVHGLEGYINDSRGAMRQNNILVPPIQRSATSRGLDSPTQNVSMGPIHFQDCGQLSNMTFAPIK